MEQVASNWQRTDVDRMMVQSPLIEVIPDALAASAGVAS